MSTTTAPDADWVLRERGAGRDLGDFVVGAGFAGSRAGFATGDGSVWIADDALASGADGWHQVAVHDGAVLCMATLPDGWVTGGDDGRLCRVGLDGAVTELARFGSRWVEQVAAWGGALAACGVGKAVHVVDLKSGAKVKELATPTAVGGLCFDTKGKRIAASHYNGVSLWFVNAREDKPRVLDWKGSHLGIAIHPGGDAVVSAMQENALHGWRLADGQHMRMSGYPAKTESLSFSRTGKWLATSGAESIVMWPFFGGGPMGKSPLELAGGDDAQCTRVGFHPQQDMVAAGFADGLVVMADVGTERVLPIAAPGRGRVSAMAWTADGTRLAWGAEEGFAAVVDLARR